MVTDLDICPQDDAWGGKNVLEFAQRETKLWRISHNMEVLLYRSVRSVDTHVFLSYRSVRVCLDTRFGFPDQQSQYEKVPHPVGPHGKFSAKPS